MGFDPVTMALVASGSALAASGASAASSILGGQAQARSLEQQARARMLQSRYTQVQADQTAAARREELKSALSTIRTLRAARGGQAAAGGAIEREVSRRAERGERIALLGFSAERAALLREAQGLRDSASSAILSGYLGAAGSILQGANAAAQLVPSPSDPVADAFRNRSFGP